MGQAASGGRNGSSPRNGSGTSATRERLAREVLSLRQCIERDLAQMHAELESVRVDRARQQPCGLTLEQRCLVVEDSPINQQVARGMLETLGHRVDLARNGIEPWWRCASPTTTLS
jgi:hypothetical protein